MDLRIIKTKMVLKKALLDIASEKPFNKITITELTQKAMINKATFYLHYKNIYGLIEEVEEELIAEFIKALGKVDSFFRNVDFFFDMMFTTFFENEKLIHILFDNERIITLQNKLVITLRDKIIEENPHINFNEEVMLILTLCLRGVTDFRLYDEFKNYTEVIEYFKEFINILTNYYKEKALNGGIGEFTDTNSISFRSHNSDIDSLIIDNPMNLRMKIGSNVKTKEKNNKDK